MKTLTSSLVVLLAAASLAAAGLTYKAPSAWKALPTSSSMRVAQFTLPHAAGDTDDAELVIYYFGGSGGTVEANITRWVGQMQQPDGKASNAVAKRETRTVNGLQATFVDVSGTYVAETQPGASTRYNKPGYRLRAAVIETPNGPYFLKLTGPAKTIAAIEKAWDEFVASVRYTP